MRARRFTDPARASEPEVLAAVTGPIAALERAPLATVGYTAARHERCALTLRTGERRGLVVKRVRLSADWTARRSGDRRGREAALLAEPALDAVWEAFACPYLAFAATEDAVALVMDDLAPFLLPDVREPLGEAQEERLLAALATLHARFWTAPALELPWLARPAHFAGLLDARCAADPDACALLPDALRDALVRGWQAALARLPGVVVGQMQAPAEEVAWLWEGLPRTLLHGDAKVANFALLPDGAVAAFDWALLGAGPASLDLGWYVAVNATRLVGTKEETLDRYRALLAARLATPPSDAMWEAMVRAGLVVGARALLWSKAVAVERDRPGARAEWAWWVERLEAACE
jgi:hypothetical protein